MNVTLIMTVNTHQVWCRTRQRSNAKDLAANADVIHKRVNDNIHTWSYQKNHKNKKCNYEGRSPFSE